MVTKEVTVVGKEGKVDRKVICQVLNVEPHSHEMVIFSFILTCTWSQFSYSHDHSHDHKTAHMTTHMIT